MKKVEVAVIPAAGLGTRFLPASKAIPKEMLPIVDRPTIEYIVAEAKASGIKEVILVISDRKQAIIEHFKENTMLETMLREDSKPDLAALVNEMCDGIKITYVDQKYPGGLGHAILVTKPVIQDRPFVVLLGDDLVINDGGLPVTKQLINEYEKLGASILGVQEVAQSETSKYGIVDPVTSGNLTLIKGMVEKPISNPPSLKAVLGRYLFTADIFTALEAVPRVPGKELQLTSGIEILLKQAPVYAYTFTGFRYDVGDKFGFVKATIDFSLKHKEIAAKVEEYLKSLK
ncbi:MAG: UTP--glucose-1-phosphate uridylyltransferase [Erysipelotrichaceae bacterium]|jgi:UTP--glucose-1-phosphate uridylyltransferase|nr:UTP--glucose-1-phosphate uridylyltransferase [Erysipelotrichaceae bacterium]